MQLEEFYSTLQQNQNIIEDISLAEMNQEVYYDEDARDMFIGRLQRYGILNQLEYSASTWRIPPVYLDRGYEGLNITKIRKESPLLIGLTGGGFFVAALWIIEGIEHEREVTERVSEEGDEFREVHSKFQFNATSTRELLAAIRKFFE